MSCQDSPSRVARASLSAVAVAAGLLGTSVSAAEPGAERVELITVTASREPGPAADAIGTLTIIDAAELQARQALTVADVLRRVPGFAHSRAGGIGTFTQQRLRGGEANHVMVMIDGIEANDLSIGSEFDFAHLLTTGVERVEVLQGPQSALWGSDALSGVVSVVTPRGQGPLAGSVQAEGGSFGTARAAATAQAGNDAAGFFLSLAHVDTDGTNISTSGGEDDGYRNTTASLKIDAAPTTDVDLQWVLRHTRARTELDDFVPSDADRRAEVRQSYLGMTADWQPAPRWSLRARASLSLNDNENFTTGVRSLLTEGKRTHVSLDVNRRLGDAQHLTLAVEGEREDFRQRSEFAGADQAQQEDQFSVVGEYRASFGAFDLQAAVRHDDNESFEAATTWRLAAAVALPTDTRLHASYARGIKNPTFTERFGFFPGSFIGNADLEPEKSDSIELGLTQSLANGRAEVRVVGYMDELQDEITTVFTPPLFTGTAVNSRRDSRRHGAQLQLDAALARSLALRASYNWLNAEDGAAGDSREVRRPQHSGSLGLTWHGIDDRLTLDGGVDWVGEQRDTDFSTFSPVTLDDHVLGHIAARFELRPGVDLTARVENLFDQNYQEVFGFANPGIGAWVGVRLAY